MIENTNTSLQTPQSTWRNDEGLTRLINILNSSNVNVRHRERNTATSSRVRISIYTYRHIPIINGMVDSRMRFLSDGAVYLIICRIDSNMATDTLLYRNLSLARCLHTLSVNCRNTYLHNYVYHIIEICKRNEGTPVVFRTEHSTGNYLHDFHIVGELWIEFPSEKYAIMTAREMSKYINTYADTNGLRLRRVVGR